MQSVFIEEVKQQLDSLCEKACQDHEPYIINRANHNHVVMMSLEDFNAWQETNYLMRSTANAKDLPDYKDSSASAKKLRHSGRDAGIQSHGW